MTDSFRNWDPRCFVVCRLLAGPAKHPLLNRKIYGCSYLVSSHRVSEVCGVYHHLVNRVKRISFVENHVLSSLPVFPKVRQPSRALHKVLAVKGLQPRISKV